MKAPGTVPSGAEWDAELSQIFGNSGVIVARLGIAFHLATLLGEYTPSTCLLEVEEQNNKWVYVFYAKNCPDKSWLEEVTAYIESTLTKHLLSTDRIVVKCFDNPIGSSCLHADSISIKMLEVVENNIMPILHKLSFKNNEYFVVVTWDGNIAVGRGGERNVILPKIPHVFFGHTHPNEVCMPSPTDLENMLDALCSGAIIEVVVSRLCSFVIRLRRPLNASEYDKFFMLVEQYKRGRINIDRLLSELDKIDSIEVQVKIGH